MRGSPGASSALVTTVLSYEFARVMTRRVKCCPGSSLSPATVQFNVMLDPHQFVRNESGGQVPIQKTPRQTT